MYKIIFECFFFYALIWWLVWFVALPIGVEDEARGGENISVGAPSKTFLRRKLIFVSLVTFVLTGIVQLSIYYIF